MSERDPNACHLVMPDAVDRAEKAGVPTAWLRDRPTFCERNPDTDCTCCYQCCTCG